LYAFSVRNIAKYSAAVIQRKAHERHDWEILSELAGRLFVPPPLHTAASRCLRAFTPERLVNALLRIGPYGLSLGVLRRSPHGLDLGALQPGCLTAQLESADQYVDIAPASFVSQARALLAAEADRDPGSDLVLIGRRQGLSNNSWMHNIHRSMRGPERFTLQVHPDDARARGLCTGARARLESSCGAITVPIEVTTAMMQGVVSLPHGWGHHRAGMRLSVAAQHAGASINDVTSEGLCDTLSGNAAFNGVAVKVQPVR
jgi:anaerobic selenocysteine-containing dehydrogenase